MIKEEVWMFLNGQLMVHGEDENGEFLHLPDDIYYMALTCGADIHDILRVSMFLGMLD